MTKKNNNQCHSRSQADGYLCYHFETHCSYNIIVLILVNKVRCIGYGMFMVGLGALLLVLPHFIDGRYAVGMLKSDHCDHSRMKSDEHQQTTSN
uniref:FXYD domain-containing ion transport regulator n=1 Tax=Heterorhabditis bacteriophora TaxID=37862 RepID=A0A1I7W8E1_HETBA